MALEIQRGIVFTAQKVVIYGPEGIGKSTFAARFPEPLFIDTEGGTKLLDVARLKRPSSWIMLLQQVDEVKRTPDCCKTLVIDTIDWAEHLCVRHVCASKDVKSIEEFGYGKGYLEYKNYGHTIHLAEELVDLQFASETMLAKIKPDAAKRRAIRKFVIAKNYNRGYYGEDKK